MSITRAAFESILREYNDKRLRAERALAERKAEIYSRLPEVEQINGRIASLSVDTAIARINGAGADLDSYRRQIEELSARKQQLLSSAGYQPSDLEPHYECRLCNDTGYIGDEMCSCFKKRIREVLYDQSNIGRVLDQENFSTFSFKYYPDEPDSLFQTSVFSSVFVIRSAFCPVNSSQRLTARSQYSGLFSIA